MLAVAFLAYSNRAYLYEDAQLAKLAMDEVKFVSKSYGGCDLLADSGNGKIPESSPGEYHWLCLNKSKESLFIGIAIRGDGYAEPFVMPLACDDPIAKEYLAKYQCERQAAKP